MTYPPQPGWQPPYPPRREPLPPYPNSGFPQQPPPTVGYGAPYGQPYGAPTSPPYAYGPQNYPYGPPNYPYGRPKKSKRSLWILLCVIAAVTTVLIVVRITGSSDEAQIKSTINQFAEAVDHNDTSKALSYVCTAEAAQMTERDGDAANDSDTVAPTTRLPVNLTDIHITGDTATAQLSRPPQQPRTVHLKKEAGTWKLCDPGPG
jgi:hypothetical protein